MASASRMTDPPASMAEQHAAHGASCSTPDASRPPAGVSGRPVTRASGISSARPGATLCAVARVRLAAPAGSAAVADNSAAPHRPRKSPACRPPAVAPESSPGRAHAAAGRCRRRPRSGTGSHCRWECRPRRSMSRTAASSIGSICVAAFINNVSGVREITKVSFFKTPQTAPAGLILPCSINIRPV